MSFLTFAIQLYFWKILLLTPTLLNKFFCYPSTLENVTSNPYSILCSPLNLGKCHF
ncbi:hypothetical protein HanXRQr2_Chr10g0424961 [Helianthus annuus]|uniref:Uncharacterized protein n=1 Tax=Helianthus annuus TaxID=4232 RepID=A0A9K3HVK6_HELAN|nr:hypothetical protein HanXRQr2_Chr10g0424961 [Helianthus annuus]